MPRPLPLAILVLAIALLLLASCTEQAPVSVIPSGNLSASVSMAEDNWNPGLGCTWRVHGTVFNAGGGDAGNALVSVQLIDAQTETIRDSETLALGTLGKGGSRSFDLLLDGECDRGYRVEVRPMEGA